MNLLHIQNFTCSLWGKKLLYGLYPFVTTLTHTSITVSNHIHIFLYPRFTEESLQQFELQTDEHLPQRKLSAFLVRTVFILTHVALKSPEQNHEEND